MPDKEVVIVGGPNKMSKSSSVYILPASQKEDNSTGYPFTQKYCSTSSFNAFTETQGGQVCDFVFGRGICCSGTCDIQTHQLPVASNLCKFYDCFTDTWKDVPNLPEQILYHQANVIRYKGRDIRWLVSGGQGKIM